MTSSIDDLAADLEQFFSRRFAPGGTDEPGAMILVFDGLGTPLQASEFARSGEGAALDLVAHQRAAQLADQLPAPNGLASGWYLPRSGSRLSRWYEAVVEGARSTATNEEDVTAFDLMRHEAERRFAENQLVVTSGTAIGGEGGTISAAGTHDAYFATTMSPLDWFSESSASWASYEVKAGDAPAPAPAPVAEAPPIVPRPMFRLRVADSARLAESGGLANYVARATVLAEQPETAISQQLQVTPSLAATALVSRSFNTSASTSGLLENTTYQRLGEAISDLNDENDLLGNESKRAFKYKYRDLITVPLATPEDHAEVVDNTTPVAPTSHGFGASFRYCLVRFDRPWWDDVFLSAHGWRLPGYDSGGISAGSATDFAGPVTLITAGMIVIRDLSITASWSADDRDALQQSTSFGPFCIAGAALQEQTGALRRPGMQAIAWLCQVPPMIPPPLITPGSPSAPVGDIDAPTNPPVDDATPPAPSNPEGTP